MRIGMFSDSYRPYTSGVVRSVETFTSELNKMGHEVFIFAPNYPDCEEEQGVYRFFSIQAPTNKEFTLALPFSFSLSTKIKKLKLDVIHIHSPFLLGRLGARWARRLGIPLVFTYHTLYDKYLHYVPLGQNITKGITQRMTVDFCNQCDRVIVPTGVIKNLLVEKGVNTTIEVVPTGINTGDFKNADKKWLRTKYNITPETKILLFVGRLGQEKNITFILDSFQQIAQSNPDTVLILVGSGSEEENLANRVAELNLTDKVIFTGRLSKEDTIKSYVGADIFVFASVTETQGLVIAEAKAAGLPVVAVDAFGVSEMVKNGKDGYLLPLDLDQYTTCIKKLLDDNRHREILGKKAIINAEELSSKNCTIKLTQVYASLLRSQQNKSLHG